MEAGTTTLSSIPERFGSEAAVIDPPAPKPSPKGKAKPKASAEAEPVPAGPQPIPGACVGLPVQFCTIQGDVVPGILQRQVRTDPSLWDLRISLSGAGVLPMRANVPHSADPKPGHWNFLPKQ